MSEVKTFTKEITFLGKALVDDVWEEGKVTKTVTFKELSQTDKSQHKLHFMISALFEFVAGTGGSADKMVIDSDKMYDLAERAVNILMVLGDGVTDADKTLILNDSFALLRFGRWFANEKATPFFLESIKV